MPDLATFSYKDYDKGSTSWSIKLADLAGANYDAQVSSVALLETNTRPLIFGAQGKTNVNGEVVANYVQPSVGEAQREKKWQIVVEDQTTLEVYKLSTIPMADLSILENGSKYIVQNYAPTITDAGNLAALNSFISAYEAIAVSKAGNSILIKDMYFIGSNV